MEATALYNADAQELIGVFSTRMLAGHYMYGKTAGVDRVATRITAAIRHKRRITASKHTLCCTVAVRHANPAQRDMLGRSGYILTDAAPKKMPREVLLTMKL